MPIFITADSEAQPPYPVIGIQDLRALARDAVAERRRRQAAAVVLEAPIEAARVALLAHLRDLALTGRPLNGEAATRVVVGVIQAYLQEPVGVPGHVEVE